MNTKNNIAATVGTRSRASVIWRTAFAAAALCIATAPSPSSAATLTHRWSFNGTTDAENLRDSVGGTVAVKKYKSSATLTVDGGTVTWSDGKAVLPGGNNGGFLNLGVGTLENGEFLNYSKGCEVWSLENS